MDSDKTSRISPDLSFPSLAKVDLLNAKMQRSPRVRFTQLFIDNEFVDSESGKKFATVDPATEKEIAKVFEKDFFF